MEILSTFWMGFQVVFVCALMVAVIIGLTKGTIEGLFWVYILDFIVLLAFIYFVGWSVIH